LHRWQRRARQGQPGRVARGEDPAAVGGDADGQHLVPFGVDGRKDQSRAGAGHGVLSAAAAEHHGDPYLPLRHASSCPGLSDPGYGLLRASRATYASEIRSPASSRPMENRTAPGSIPPAASARSSSWRWVVEATWLTTVCVPPSDVATCDSRSLSTKPMPASPPPCGVTVTIAPNRPPSGPASNSRRATWWPRCSGKPGE